MLELRSIMGLPDYLPEQRTRRARFTLHIHQSYICCCLFSFANKTKVINNFSGTLHLPMIVLIIGEVSFVKKFSTCQCFGYLIKYYLTKTGSENTSKKKVCYRFLLLNFTNASGILIPRTWISLHLDNVIA